MTIGATNRVKENVPLSIAVLFLNHHQYFPKALEDFN